MKLRITVDEKAYDVEVDVIDDDGGSYRQGGSGPRLATGGGAASVGSSTAPKQGEGVADESKVARSPIMGIVVKVNCQVGQQIQPNDPLVVLEAMKMESSITAASAGKIKAVNVKPGDGVEKNQVIVVFE